VLLVLHSELLGGASISVLNAVPLLEELGWRFAYWVPQPGPAADWLRERGAEVHGEERPIASGLPGLREPPGLRRRLAATPGYLRRFRATLRAVSPALVHANSLYSFAEGLTASAGGRPTVLHLHDMAPAGRKRAIARAIARRGSSVPVAVSEACAESYAAGGWRPRVVYESAPVPASPVSIRERPRPFVVGTVGVISRRKGSDVFVEAARQVLASGPEFAFEMVGKPTDPLEREWGERVVEMARSVGVTHRQQADIAATLRGWDAFVLPSRMDPCPLVLLEAMANGLPVIGSRADGIPEQIAPGCGLLVPVDDPRGLAEAIRRLAAMSATERTRMGAAGRRRVADVFSVERQAEGLARAYRDALAR
jgi:glycosyltransferase involved in cell wall biosynthesis